MYFNEIANKKYNIFQARPEHTPIFRLIPFFKYLVKSYIYQNVSVNKNVYFFH